MSLRKSLSALGLIAFVVPFFFVGCEAKPPDQWANVEGGNKRILVSFPPLYCFAKQIAGPDARVLCLVNELGVHHFEPTPDDVFKASKADLILYNGLGLDDEKVLRLAGSAGKKADAIAVAEKAVQNVIMSEKRFHADAGGGHWHEAGPDPHVWLGPKEAMAMVAVVRDAIVKVDPANKEKYDKRAEAYLDKIRELERLGTEALKNKKANIITQHGALKYFERNFEGSLKIVDNIQINPGVEADAGKLADLAARCMEGNVRVIATEPQYPDTAARKVCDYLHKEKNFEVKIVEFDTLETADPNKLKDGARSLDKDYYLNTMRRNIENLAKSLP
jgi:zinc transport system substrate-binding protein